ncbi:MAG: hypothetical protein KC731_41555 [Myxococcales bacterium]|nr:hypothetical protein [Myxococcales bacterium]
MPYRRAPSRQDEVVLRPRARSYLRFVPVLVVSFLMVIPRRAEPAEVVASVVFLVVIWSAVAYLAMQGGGRVTLRSDRLLARGSDGIQPLAMDVEHGGRCTLLLQPGLQHLSYELVVRVADRGIPVLKGEHGQVMVALDEVREMLTRHGIDVTVRMS